MSSFCTSEPPVRGAQKQDEGSTLPFDQKVRQFLVEEDIDGFAAIFDEAILEAREVESKSLEHTIQDLCMHLCVQEKEYSVAVTIGDEMERNGDTMSSDVQAIWTQAMFSNELVILFGRRRYTYENEGPGQETFMFSDYLEALNEIGEFEKTLTMFKKGKKQDLQKGSALGQPVDQTFRERRAYQAAIFASSKMADVAAAKSLLKAIGKNGWTLKYRELNVAIHAALKANDYEQAMEWHTQVLDSQMESREHGDVYSDLIAHFAEKQEWEKVIALSEECIGNTSLDFPLQAVPHYLQALLEMQLWEKAVVELSRATKEGFSDSTGELTQRIYNKVLENEDADGLALVLKSYVWTAREFTNEEVLDQLTLLSKGDHQETIHWLIQIGTRGYSDQMLSLILSNDTIPMSMKNSVQEHKIAYSNVSRFQNAVDMHQVDTIVDLVNEHQELDDLFQTENKDFFPVVIDALFDRAIGNCEVECILIQVLDHHLATYKDSSLFTTVWDRAVTLLVEEHEDLNSEKDLPIALVFALLHSAKVHGIEIESTRISFLMDMSIANLGVVKMLYKKGVPFSDSTFTRAAIYGSSQWDAGIETLEWLHEKGCPWGDLTLEICDKDGLNLDDKDIFWLEERGCPKD